MELNEYGKRIWYRYSGRLTLERSYKWVDSLILIDEENNRKLITTFNFSTFDFTDWTPMTLAEYKIVCSSKKLWEQ